MPSKYQEYRQMADTAERQLTSSYKSWTQFLRTAARLYKYPYNEQVMIHAQRPDATACAEYDFWNKKMGRFVRRGSTGIALIDTSGQKPQLRYVFDVADTGEREHSRLMHLWQFRAEHEDAVAAALERNYGVSGNDGIVEQMEAAAVWIALTIARSRCTSAVNVTQSMITSGGKSILLLRPVTFRKTHSVIRTSAERSWLAEPNSGQMLA